MRVSDAQLHELILHALESDLDLGDHDLGIAVSRGVVTLSGFLDTEQQARALEQVVSRVPGVTAVMQTTRVGTADQRSRSDTAIAHRVVDHLAQRLGSMENRLVVRVEHGWVTLEGEVDLACERTDAEETILRLPAVRGVSNHLTVRPPETVARIRAKMDALLNRPARLTALLSAHPEGTRGPLAAENDAVGEERLEPSTRNPKGH
ncbi:MAG: BON domain-containing protein [Gemmatimonadales bacterium]